jgi:predicted HTH transcriptional regulator
MILKHRDKELLRFEWIEPQGIRIVSVNEASSKSGTVNPVNGESLALQIIANLKADPFVSYDELSELMEVPRRTVARRIKELTDAGKIRRMGASKNGYWEVL